MRGVARYDKDDVIEMLKAGIAPTEISKKMQIPLSTVTTYLSEIRKKQRSSADATKKRLEAIQNASMINDAEARIVNLVLPYIDPDIDDDIWDEIETKINKEIQSVIAKFL